MSWTEGKQRIATTACVCVDVGRILLFSLDTIRMFEHFFVLYFDLSVTCCRCGICFFFYNRNTLWIYDYDYDVLKLNSWFTVLIWVGPGSAWKYGFSIIFSINRSIAQQINHKNCFLLFPPTENQFNLVQIDGRNVEQLAHVLKISWPREKFYSAIIIPPSIFLCCLQWKVN